MSLSDPIADMLTRLRNGLQARHETVTVRNSKVCEGVCKVLQIGRASCREGVCHRV